MPQLYCYKKGMSILSGIVFEQKEIDRVAVV
jgi:hypothetical protein